MKDSESLESELSVAINDFAKGDLQSMIKAVQEFGAIVVKLPVIMKDCEHV